jgi:GPH family glycoside/pentoside/hexuronide:cation symporter
MHQERLSKKTIFSYAAIAIPLAMLGLPLYIYLPTFYAQNIGLNVTIVGLILFISRVTDVITDPLVGFYSDRFQSQYGKRKPFMLFGAIVLTISFYALVHPPQVYTGLWLLTFSIFVYLGWSVISIPYLAWSAEITSIYHEKTRLSAAREISTIVGSIGALLIPYFYGVSEDVEKSMSLLYLAFVLLLVLMLPVTLFGTKEGEVKSKQSVAYKDIKKIWQNAPGLKNLQMAFLLNSLANALPATLFLFFVQLVIDAEGMTGVFLLLYFTAGIIGLPVWTILSKRIGKRKAWQVSMISASLAFIFVLFLGSGDVLAFGIISVVSGLSLGADMALPSSIQADIVQKVQSKQRSYAGILFAFWAMLTKLALALAVGIGFVILGLVDFDPNDPTPLALGTLALLYGGVPVVIKLFAFWLIRGYLETD